MSFRAATVAGLTAFFIGVLALVGAALWVSRPGAVGETASSSVGGAFQLVDHDGKPVTAADLGGRPFLVFFGFTHCPDVCPTTLFEISEAIDALGPDADKLSALFVSVDPERDTPAALKRYLSSFSPRIRGLTGEPAAVDAAVKAYRAYARKAPLENGGYTMDHSTVVYLMDRNGRFVAPLSLRRRPAEIADELRRHL